MEVRREQRSIGCCWIDFKIAFDIIRHKLVDFALSHYHLSSHSQNVVKNMYSSLIAVVQTQAWLTKSFPYRDEVFQSELNSAYHFKATGDSLQLSLFADDAALVANSVQNLQKLCKQTDAFLLWSKIEPKAIKCRSLAFKKRPTNGFLTPILLLVEKNCHMVVTMKPNFLAFLLT